ncbi:MAG: hypothetical protein ACKVS8_06120 [Phycisphaerales bacterium]
MRTTFLYRSVAAAVDTAMLCHTRAHRGPAGAMPSTNTVLSDPSGTRRA